MKTLKVMTGVIFMGLAVSSFATEPTATEGFDVRTTFELSIKAPSLEAPRIVQASEVEETTVAAR